MDGSKVQYIVDEKGKPRSVALSIAEYKRLLAKLEDAEDALALDEARRNTTSFTDFEKVKADLKKAERLCSTGNMCHFCLLQLFIY